MITQTEMRDCLLQTLAQLGKFIDLMEDYEYGYSENEVKLLKILQSFADQAKDYGEDLVLQDTVIDEPIPK